ncbi:PAS domain S-box protein [Brevundimonas sp. WCHBH090558]|nr:PAS domain S-box protein [Brevundimonas huaxiensis]
MDSDPELPPAIADPSAWLKAVIDNLDDAIVTKTLDGVIRSWNGGAERLFGFRADEIIGRPVTLLIPDDRLHEEASILARLKDGHRVERFETVRRRKDGSLVDVAVTISPVRDPDGRVVGASKLARDISEEKRAAERQSLLLREMHHRIKNLFAMTAGLVLASAKEAQSVDALASDLSARVLALSKAHALTMPDLSAAGLEQPATSFKALLSALVAPHKRDGGNVSIEGADLKIGAQALPMVALLLHELTTNAVKYGALSNGKGCLHIHIAPTHDSVFELVWDEAGDEIAPQGDSTGFGSLLERATLKSLDASLERAWRPEGLRIVFRAPAPRLQGG